MAAMLANTTSRPSGGWGAVLALTLCVSTLIASEFMPVSLLTPIASGLRVTEGQAGQAIAVIRHLRRPDQPVHLNGDATVWTAARCCFASPGDDCVGHHRRPRRRTSRCFMVGRALIGVVIGGFWSMSTATVMRLVPKSDVPRALALLNGGNALATTIAAPLGQLPWPVYRLARSIFLCRSVRAGHACVAVTDPAEDAEPGTVECGCGFKILRRPQVPLGMLAVGLFFMGQFALFTYLRPFLETVTGVGVSTLSLILLIWASPDLAGTYVIGQLLKKTLYGLLIGMPVAMAAIAAGLIVFGSSAMVVAALLAVWGLIATAAPVGWWTWMSKVLPDEAEAGGGLMVAVIQLAITLGASVGGLLFDGSGYRATFGASAAILGASALTALVASRSGRRNPSFGRALPSAACLIG